MAWQDQQDQDKLRQNANNLFGGWNDFWANFDKSLNTKGPQGSQLKNKPAPLIDGNRLGDWSGLGSVNYAGPSKDHLLGSLSINKPSPRSVPANRSPQGSNSLQLLRSLNTNKLPGMRESANVPRDSSDGGPVPLSGDALLEKELRDKLSRDFEPTGEYSDMVEQAYASALANIGKARGQANSNFATSDAKIADLTAGHVNEIKTSDREAVQKIGGELQSGYKDVYGDARAQIQSDQSAEMAAKTEMLQRLGIQEAGIGTAGRAQSEALTRLSQNEAGAMQQAKGYQAADETRNVEQAQSQASAGVERRSALSRDLQKIMGNLDDSEASVQSSIAMGKLQGRQSEKSDFMREQQFNADSLSRLEDKKSERADKDRSYALDLQKIQGKQKGSASAVDVVSESIRNRGIEPQPYLDAYNEAFTSGEFNPIQHGDKNMWTAQKIKQLMEKKGLRADLGVAVNLVQGISNFGTDKLNNNL